MKDWVMEILHDKELRGELRFDAQRLYRHNGTEFERFINEPWTANLWWEIQVSGIDIVNRLCRLLTSVHY